MVTTYGTYRTCLVSIRQRDNTVICCARAISDEEGANRKRFPTVVYDGELVYILPNVKMTFKLAGDVDPPNINVICIDFKEFPRVNRCNRMSF